MCFSVAKSLEKKSLFFYFSKGLKPPGQLENHVFHWTVSFWNSQAWHVIGMTCLSPLHRNATLHCVTWQADKKGHDAPAQWDVKPEKFKPCCLLLKNPTKTKNKAVDTPCWYPVLLDFTVFTRFSWFSQASFLYLIINHANIGFCFCVFYLVLLHSPDFLQNTWQTFVEILYAQSTCDMEIWVIEVPCTTFGTATCVNKNCSKITVITWHAASHGSKSMKVLAIFFGCVRLLRT